MEPKIKWHIERRKVADLKLWDKNPRKLRQEDYEALKHKIIERGFHDIFKIDTDNTILSGNQRKLALIELGVLEVNVMVPERALTEKERDAVGIESNKHAAVWDFEVMANLFEPSDLMEYGFSMGELGMAPNAGKEIIDKDNMASALEGYMNADIKQIVLYFKGTEYEEIIKRLDAVVAENSMKDYSEAFLKLLETYESSRTAPQGAGL